MSGYLYVAVDIGCLECGYASNASVFATEDSAKAAFPLPDGLEWKTGWPYFWDRGEEDERDLVAWFGARDGVVCIFRVAAP